MSESYIETLNTKSINQWQMDNNLAREQCIASRGIKSKAWYLTRFQMHNTKITIITTVVCMLVILCSVEVRQGQSTHQFSVFNNVIIDSSSKTVTSTLIGISSATNTWSPDKETWCLVAGSDDLAEQAGSCCTDTASAARYDLFEQAGPRCIAAAGSDLFAAEAGPRCQVIAGADFLAVKAGLCCTATAGSVGLQADPRCRAIAGSVGLQAGPCCRALAGSVGLQAGPCCRAIAGSNSPAAQAGSRCSAGAELQAKTLGTALGFNCCFSGTHPDKEQNKLQFEYITNNTNY